MATKKIKFNIVEVDIYIIYSLCIYLDIEQFIGEVELRSEIRNIIEDNYYRTKKVGAFF